MADPRWEAYQIGAARCMGLDLKRTQYINDFGNYVANASADFRAGMLVSLNAAQEVIKCTGANPLGFAKFDKTTGRYATVVGETITLPGTTAMPLAHANLLTAAGSVAGIRVGIALTGTAYIEGATDDYAVNYTNGTVARVTGSAIADGATVFVNYMYALTAADENHEGKNFWMQTDDVSIQDNCITVITPPGARIFTSQYDPTVTYTVNAVLYSGSVATDVLGGYVTTKTTSSATIGKVIQIPTADDPYLGVEFYL